VGTCFTDNVEGGNMRVRVKIEARGVALRQAYVEHLVWGVGVKMYMTDRDGNVRDEDLNQGIDSITPNASIRIICQNPLLRILDGNLANIGVYKDKDIVDRETVNLNTDAEQDDYFAILNRVHVAYEFAFRHLSFFRALPDPDFPLGRKATLSKTRDQAKRIDMIYPDHSVATLAWVEPSRLGDKFPLIHIKSREEDVSLFGDNGYAATLIPHEFSHALHFSFLSQAQRDRAEYKYGEFIVTSPVSGVGPYHAFDKRTTPEVAYIEAGGFYGENFIQFVRGEKVPRRAGAITASLQRQFVRSEWLRLARYPKVVSMIPYAGGVVTAFVNKQIYFSADGRHLGGSQTRTTRRVYGGDQSVVKMIPYGSGVITAFADHAIYFSPDGQHLGGGGNTVRVYEGMEKVVAMIPYAGGVITAFSDHAIYFSPDGRNLGGGGRTTRVYGGDQSVVTMIPYRSGIITAFSGHNIYFSPDGRNLGGGGSTVRVYGGDQSVTAMIPYNGGVITAFSSKHAFFSPDGQHLGGGGNTVRVYGRGTSKIVKMVPYAGGVFTVFANEDNSIRFSLDGRHLGGDGTDGRVYEKVVEMILYENGVITAFSGRGIYFSPDGNDLAGGGDTLSIPASPVPRNLLQPIVSGGDVEGAVYGAIFADFARFTGLDFAASAYFKANAITFGEYRTFINERHPEFIEALENACDFWGL
jgi:hypothetical protein